MTATKIFRQYFYDPVSQLTMLSLGIETKVFVYHHGEERDEGLVEF